MQPILILTKNLLVEQRVQEQLQQLNYEVLCSVQLLQRLKREEKVEVNHQIIIFSETVTNREIEGILERIPTENKLLFRKFCDVPTYDVQEELNELGLSDWLTETISLDQLRERLAEKIEELEQAEERKRISLRENPDLKDQMIEHFLKALTKKERKTFLYLQQAEGEIVSREELCEYLWKEPLSHSRMSQLSVLIKNIKEKLKSFGFGEDSLRTIWGSGYCMTEISLLFAQKVGQEELVSG